MPTTALALTISLAGLAQPATTIPPASPNPAPSSPLDAVIDPAAKPERLCADSEFQFLEGPTWVPTSAGHAGYLLFSDIPADTIYKWTPGDSAGAGNPGGTLEPLIKPSRHANGLMLDPQGRLVACEHERRMVRFDTITTDARPTVLAEAFEGKKLSSPNDLDIRADGAIYFTDPPYGLGGGLGKPGAKELDFQGVFRIGPDGALSLLTKDLDMPNGLAFSADEKRLYIADMGRSEIRLFDVKPDGSIESNRLFAEVRTDAGKPAGGDGLRLDTEGRVYVAGRNGIHVFDPAGKKLGVIAVPQGPANLCFGGDDHKSMFITARKGLYRVSVKTAGQP